MQQETGEGHRASEQKQACQINAHDYFGSCISYEQRSVARSLVKNIREPMRALAALKENSVSSSEGTTWPYHGNKGNGKGGTENCLL